MIQYETRLQNQGRSRKLSFYKKDVIAGEHPRAYSLEGNNLVLKEIGLVTNHGKHDLLFVSIGSSKSLQCRDDTKLLTPTGWVAVKDLAVGDIVVSVRTALQRTRAGERGPYVDTDEVIDAGRAEVPITEIRKSHIM